MSKPDRMIGSDRVRVGLSGRRFRKLERELSHRQGVYNPRGLAAYIGRKKYGKAKFQRLSVQGRQRHGVGFDRRYELHPGKFRFKSHAEFKDIKHGDYVYAFKPSTSVNPYRERVQGYATVDEPTGRVFLTKGRPHPLGCGCPYHEGHKKKTPRILHGIGRGPGLG